VVDRLHKDDWLHIAKRLCVGARVRVQHGRERRQNMTVGHEGDHYWAYCQACKASGRVDKEHVRITDMKAPAESHSLVLPDDMVKVLDADKAVQDAVGGFLASKNMDPQYLPELWFSRSRCRLLFMHGCEWLGRDTTGASMQKWLTFNQSNHLHHTWGTGLAVVVEDPFSYFKVRWALRDKPVYAVYSSLGTRMSDELMLLLLKSDHVTFFYDDDAAGHKGAATESHRLRALGVQAVARCATLGRDPKDMTIEEIRQHIGG
jgi:hypothetical protein